MCVCFFKTDFDECKDPKRNECHKKAKCTNTEGSYNCTCIDGYVGNGTLCQGMVAILLFASLIVTMWCLLWGRGVKRAENQW